MYLALGLVALVLLLGGLYLLLSREPASAREVHHLRCKKCGQRLKYLGRQVGKPAACPNCRTQFTYPPPSKAGK